MRVGEPTRIGTDRVNKAPAHRQAGSGDRVRGPTIQSFARMGKAAPRSKAGGQRLAIYQEPKMATKKTFDFKLGDSVNLALSGEKGEIVGRAHYVNAIPSYLVRYVAADGRQIETWLAEDAITG